jgi:hypothetical protein
MNIERTAAEALFSSSNSGHIVELGEAEFVESFLNVIGQGYRVLPFVGAGLSQASGIPTVKNLRRYLTFCIWKLLGHPFDKVTHTAHGPLWEPRKDWPKMAGQIHFAPLATRWDTADLQAEIHSFLTTLKDDHERNIALEAYGSLADWRTALHFLSRVASANYSEGKPIITLSVPDNSIIDSFFLNQVENRQPNLGHRLLVALMPFFRANLIFTTNFDDLIEKAFALSGIPLATFEMPQPTSLPSARIVLKHTALLKLHGGRFGLRADYSIDAHPSRLDRWNFLSYLLGYPIQAEYEDLPEGRLSSQNRLSEKVALFFTGSSASDRRTRNLIKTACSAFRNLKVLWLCFSKHDVAVVRSLAEDCHQEEADLSQRFVVCHSTDQPMVMLQLYQRQTLSVPASGMFYPALGNVRSHPLIPRGNDEEKCRSIEYQAGKLKRLVEDTLAKAGPATPVKKHPILIAAQPSVYGGVTLCSHFCDQTISTLSDTTRSIWINLDELVRPIGILIRLVIQIGRFSGEQDPMSSLDPDSLEGTKSEFELFKKKVEDIIATATTQLGGRWVVFLNGQEGIGSHPLFRPVADEAGWESTASIDRVAEVIEMLTQSQRSGICFVLLLRKRKRTAEKFFLKRWPQQITIDKDLTQFNRRRVLKAAVQLAAEEIPAWFFYLLTRFRSPQFVAGLARICCRYHLQNDGDFARQLTRAHLSASAGKVDGWLKTLEKEGVIRFLPGGLVWMHQSLRADLLRCFRLKVDITTRLKLGSLVARWQGRLLLASSDPLAAWECGVCALDSVADWLHARRLNVRDRNLGVDLTYQIIRHFQHVLSTARKLLLLRLSNNFADRALHDLERRVPKLEPRRGGQISLALKHAKADIRNLRVWLYLQEGEFDKVKVLCDRNGLLLLRPHQRLEARLHLAAALLCKRDYAKASARIRMVLKDLGFSLREVPNAPERTADAWLKNCEDLQKRKVFVLAARRMCYLYLHMSQAQFLANRNVDGRWEQRSELLRKSIAWATCGLEVLRSVETMDSGYVFVQNIRLRAHMALAMALLEAADVEGEPQQTLRLTNSEAVMGDAQSYLEEFPLQQAGVDLAILELRKAEIELIRLGTHKWFNALRKSFDHNSPQPHFIWTQEELMSGKARLLDAFAHLNRAEAMLRMHRKSRWWWWLFTTLKMKASEYLFVLRLGWVSIAKGNACVDHSRHMIPPFIREFCRSGMKQLLDEFDCNDIFLLARIVHSYGRALGAVLAYAQQGPRTNSKGLESRDYFLTDKWLPTYESVLTKLEKEFAVQRKEHIFSAVWRYADDCLNEGQLELKMFKQSVEQITREGRYRNAESTRATGIPVRQGAGLSDDQRSATVLVSHPAESRVDEMFGK